MTEAITIILDEISGKEYYAALNRHIDVNGDVIISMELYSEDKTTLISRDIMDSEEVGRAFLKYITGFLKSGN